MTRKIVRRGGDCASTPKGLDRAGPLVALPGLDSTAFLKDTDKHGHGTDGPERRDAPNAAMTGRVIVNGLGRLSVR